MEAFVLGVELTEFFKSSRVGSKAFIAQWCSNRHGWYLALAEYGGGGQRYSIL
jgi:hypothetical protein